MTDPKQVLPPLGGWRMALDKAPQFLSVMLVFLVPLLTQLEGADPIFLKWTVTQFLVFLMLGAWLLRIALDGRIAWVYSKALLALFALMVWLLATVLLSPYEPLAWLKLRDFLCYPLWYLLLTFTCVELWRAENLLITFLVTGLASCLWAIGQALGWGSGEWLNIVQTQFGGRVAAGFGDPESLAGYLLMIWPLALALLLRAVSGVSRAFWALIVISSLVSLLWTGSKAGWSGFVAGLLVFGFFVLKDRQEKAYQWLGLLLVFLVLSFFLGPMAPRLRDMASPKSGSLQVHRTVWKGVMEMIQERPLQGTGFGTFSAAYPSHRPISLRLRPTQRKIEVDHARNWVLEWTAETGLVGLGLLFTFWFFVLAQWWKLYSANAVPKPLVVGVFAALTGVAVDGLFEMNCFLPSTLVPLLFLAAFPVALSQRFFRMPQYPIQYKVWDLAAYRLYLLPLLVAAIALIFQQIGTVFTRQMADVQLKKAVTLSMAKKWKEAIPLYDHILTLDPGNLKARYFRGSAYFDSGEPEGLEKALWDFNGLAHYSPDYDRVHFAKARVLKTEGRSDESEAEMKRAIQLDPLLVLQLEDYRTARKWIDDKKFKEAIAVYQKLLLDYPTCVPVLVDEAKCLATLERRDEAMALYREVLKLDPDDPEAAAQLKALAAN